MRHCVWSCLLTFCVANASDSPWITSDAPIYSPHPAPSAFSLDAFHHDPVFKDLAPKEFCRRLFDLYYDGRRKSWGDFKKGLTLWAHTPQEPRASANLIEHDPIVLLNVHGTGYCGIQSGLLEGIYQSRPGGEIGKPAIDARRWFLKGIIHSVCDAYYDGKWHYYDIDLGGWAGDAEKDVWSVADIIADPKGYWTDKTTIKSSYFHSKDSKGQWVEKITGAYAFQDNHMLGHEMTFRLPKGSVFTRWFSLAAAGWDETLPHTKKIDPAQKGGCEWVWTPDAATAEAEALVQDGNARVWHIRCPYNITSSKVETVGKASVSTDLGRTWAPIDSDGSVKAAVNGWDYLLRIEGGDLKKVVTRGLCHPGALPRVGSGPTQMTVAQAAPYRTLTYVLDWSSQESFAASCQAPDFKWKASKVLTFTDGEIGGKGTVTIPVPAPPGGKLVKVSACVVAGLGSQVAPDKFLEVHIGPKGQAQLAGKTTDCSGWGKDPKTRVEHWQSNVNGSAAFEPCAEAEVKITATHAARINGVRLFAHFLPDQPAANGGTLTVTHGFDGKTSEHKIPVADLEKGPATYSVPGPAQVNEFVRMEVR